MALSSTKGPENIYNTVLEQFIFSLKLNSTNNDNGIAGSRPVSKLKPPVESNGAWLVGLNARDILVS